MGSGIDFSVCAMEGRVFLGCSIASKSGSEGLPLPPLSSDLLSCAGSSSSAMSRLSKARTAAYSPFTSQQSVFLPPYLGGVFMDYFCVKILLCLHVFTLLL